MLPTWYTGHLYFQDHVSDGNFFIKRPSTGNRRVEIESKIWREWRVRRLRVRNGGSGECGD